MLRPSTVIDRPTWLLRKENTGSQVRRVPVVKRKRASEGWSRSERTEGRRSQEDIWRAGNASAG